MSDEISGEEPRGLQFPGDHELIAIGPPGLDFQRSLEQLLIDAGGVRTSTIGSSWQSLTLVDDREVEIQVSAERFALTLQHDCEWELRDLDALMTGLLHNPHANRTETEVRNPLRPEVIGKAMVAACDAISERDGQRYL